jgi:hypothetical protein
MALIGIICVVAAFMIYRLRPRVAALLVLIGLTAMAGLAIIGAILPGIVGTVPDSQMTMRELGGLTSEQVISRLGEPVVDTRDKKYGGNDPNQSFELYYKDRRWYSGFGYTISFIGNHVANVHGGQK